MPRGCGSANSFRANLGPTPETVSSIGAMDASLLLRNRSIVPEGPLVRKMPRKAASFQVPRNDLSSGLPERSPEVDQSGSIVRGRFRREKSAMNFRAAEKGKHDLLPTTMPSIPPPGLLNRGRTLSSGAMWNRRKTSPSLRSRRRSSVQIDDLDKSGSRHNGRHLTHSWSDLADVKASRSTKYLKRDYTFTDILRGLKPSFLLQAAVVIAVAFLVWDSHHKNLLTSEKLHQFRHDESMLMIHLQRLEQQSIHLHENLGRLNDAKLTDSSRNSSQHKAPASVDTNLIQKQLGQLHQMEKELEHEVRSLRTKIKQSARSSIIHKYGEGPVQVVLDVVPTNSVGEETKDASADEEKLGGQISILLWHDTPHAAWTWLEQIELGTWNDVPLELNKGMSVNAAVDASEDEPRLQFVESAQKAHEAWTVGLSDLMDGGLGIFINLRDNSDYHKHEACVGKVLDGFDVLQKIVDSNREEHASRKTLKIKLSTASHLTRKETAGLV